MRKSTVDPMKGNDIYALEHPYVQISAQNLL
jgi:hypothetical protein